MPSVVSIPRTDVREGTTERILMQLLADDVAIDLSAVHHIEVEIRDMRRNTYRYSSLDASPRVGIQIPTEGTVFFDPPVSLFKTILSPFLGYVWVFETETRKFSVPEDTEFFISVRRNW